MTASTGGMTVLDLFCGAGGFTIGFELSDYDFEVVGGIDMDESAVSTFEANHSDAVGIVDDLASIRPEAVSELVGCDTVDVIVGGPPCKGFSSIRPNRSSDEIDYRNYLYQDYLRFVEFFEPSVFVMENVTEIVNHTIQGEEVLDMILDDVEQLGYEYEWRMLNAAYYGVPQSRIRFILVGVRDDDMSVQFPEPTHYFEDEAVERQLVRYDDLLVQPESTDDKKPVVKSLEAISDLPFTEAGEIENTYATRPQNTFQELMRTKPDGELLTGDALTEHRATNHSDEMVEALKRAGFKRTDIPEPYRPNSGYAATYSRQYPEKPATTLTTEYTTAGGTRCLHPSDSVARALTVREGMRLQSFPDWITFKGSKTSITNQVGNAVPPLLGKAIGESVADIILEANQIQLASD